MRRKANAKSSVRAGKVQIEDNVPIPKATIRHSWKPLLESMRIGESFLLPKDAGKYARAAIMMNGRLNGKKFMVKTTDAGRRCWRVE